MFVRNFYSEMKMWKLGFDITVRGLDLRGTRVTGNSNRGDGKLGSGGIPLSPWNFLPRDGDRTLVEITFYSLTSILKKIFLFLREEKFKKADIAVVLGLFYIQIFFNLSF